MAYEGNRYAGLNRRREDKASWLEPALTAAGAVVGSIVPGVGTAAGAAAGRALGSAGHSMANGGGAESLLQPGMQAFQTFRPSVPQTGISPQGGGTQPTLPTPDPSVPDFGGMDNRSILQMFMQNPSMFRRGYANGGLVTGPAMDMASQWAEMDPVQRAMLQARGLAGNEPVYPTVENGQLGALQQAKHPTLEALASLMPDLLGSLPKPADPRNTKAIGAWAPFAGQALAAPATIAQARRTAANAPVEARNLSRQQQYARDKAAHESRVTTLSDTLVGNATKPMSSAESKPRVPVMRSDWEYMRQRNALPPAIVEEANANGGTLSAEGYQSFQQAVDNLRGTENSARIASAQSAASGAREEKAAAASDADEQFAQGLADYSQDPLLLNPRSPNFTKVAARADELLREKGSPYTLAQLRLMSKEAGGFLTVQNQQRFTALRQSAVTVRKHLEQFKEFYRKYSRIKPPLAVRMLGKTQFELALEGWLGVPAQTAAAELAGTNDAVAREAALVFTSGYAPLEHDVESSRRNLEVASMSRSAGEGSIKALERLLEARINTAMSATPFASGKDNPYLKAFNPKLAWNEAASEPPKPEPLMSAHPSTGTPPAGYVPPGLKPVKEGN